MSNAAELAAWIETVRGPTSVVVETRRPVRLDDHYLVGDRTNDQLHFLPTFVGGFPNPDAAKIDAQAVRRGRYGQRPARGSGQRVLYTPGRLETIDAARRQRNLLPAIYFIFSRNQCEEAARQRRRRRHAADRSAAARGDPRDPRRRGSTGLDEADLAVLGYDELAAQLDAGVAPHHAGMVPAFKEAVEQCFIAGLLGAVFATETLAVGVNMPARTVVIEKLTKFTGDHHELLTPGEYTQLTGRAGRRGIDDVGQAVVLWSPFVSFDRVAALAGSRAFNLRSAFRPTYNMAANLVRTYTSEQAHHLLNLSFAQYQADRDVVRLEARAERLRSSVSERPGRGREPLRRHLGVPRQTRRRAAGRRAAPSARRRLARLRPGDVVEVTRGRYRGPAVMVASAVAQGRDAPDRDLRGCRVVARHRRRRDRACRAARQGAPAGNVPAEGPAVPPRGRQAARPHVAAQGRQGSATASGRRRRRTRSSSIPSSRQRMRAAGAGRAARARARRHRRSGGRATTARSSREFDRVIGVLEHRGYLRAPGRRLVADRQGHDARQRVPRV